MKLLSGELARELVDDLLDPALVRKDEKDTAGDRVRH
jgi:hypothetical protein